MRASALIVENLAQSLAQNSAPITSPQPTCLVRHALGGPVSELSSSHTRRPHTCAVPCGHMSCRAFFHDGHVREHVLSLRRPLNGFMKHGTVAITRGGLEVEGGRDTVPRSLDLGSCRLSVILDDTLDSSTNRLHQPDGDIRLARAWQTSVVTTSGHLCMLWGTLRRR